LPGSYIVVQTPEHDVGFAVVSTEVRLRASYQELYVTLQLTICVFCWSVQLRRMLEDWDYVTSQKVWCQNAFFSLKRCGGLRWEEEIALRVNKPKQTRQSTSTLSPLPPSSPPPLNATTTLPSLHNLDNTNDMSGRGKGGKVSSITTPSASPTHLTLRRVSVKAVPNVTARFFATTSKVGIYYPPVLRVHAA